MMDPFALGAHYLASAHYLAHAAAASSLDVPESYPHFDKLRLARVQTFGSPDLRTRGFVAANGTAVVVAFRGTRHPADWITSLNYAQVEGCGGKVHQGFAEALDSVWGQVLDRLATLRDRGQRIWLTGHSLGGALATLAALRLPEAFAPEGVHTFGQPRVGDPEFAAAYGQDLRRWVHGRDIVPNFPLPGLFNRYRHVGDLSWIDLRGNIQEMGRRDWLSADSLALLAMQGLMEGRMTEDTMRDFVEAGIRDHAIERYIEKLLQNIPGQ